MTEEFWSPIQTTPQERKQHPPGTVIVVDRKGCHMQPVTLGDNGGVLEISGVETGDKLLVTSIGVCAIEVRVIEKTGKLRIRERIAWWLMGLPTGVREPNEWLLRYGPYRWGAALMPTNCR